MAAVLADNPFDEAPGNRVVAIFLHDPPPAHAPDTAKHQQDERIHCGQREIYVHYGEGRLTRGWSFPQRRREPHAT